MVLKVKKTNNIINKITSNILLNVIGKNQEKTFKLYKIVKFKI